MQQRTFCICCGYDTMFGEPGHYEICPICFWEDDPIQRDNIDENDGANKVSLRQAQINFEVFGACEEDMIKNVIKPNSGNKQNPNWKLKQTGK